MRTKQKRAPMTEAYKNEIRIGREIADRLPQLMSQSEVAKKLGMSRAGVAQCERRALYKLQQRLRAALGGTQEILV